MVVYDGSFEEIDFNPTSRSNKTITFPVAGMSSFVSFDMDKYNLILNKCKIALVFLSSINSDTYTRRCYEIPIVKTLVIAPYNKDLSAMFQDGTEAVLYKDKDDFVKKVKYYLENDAEREKIAIAGYKAVKEGKNEAADRVRQILSDYKVIKCKSAGRV